MARNVVRGVERVAHQHGVGARCVQLAVGLIGNLELRQHRAALELERLGEDRLLRGHGADRARIVRCVQLRSQKPKNPFSLRQKRVSGPVSLAVFV
jgi:hypothetical protein